LSIIDTYNIDIAKFIVINLLKLVANCGGPSLVGRPAGAPAPPPVAGPTKKAPPWSGGDVEWSYIRNSAGLALIPGGKV
jgi:hypothetical protein